MCNYGTAVQTYGERIGEQIGERKGTEKTILAVIRNLRETMNWSAQEAMDAVKVPKDEQEKYRKML